MDDTDKQAPGDETKPPKVKTLGDTSPPSQHPDAPNHAGVVEEIKAPVQPMTTGNTSPLAPTHTIPGKK